MPESNRPLIERVARVLAGAAHSSNAEGSDPSAGEKVDRVWREHGFTALFVTHDVAEAVALADRVIVLDAGRVQLDLAIEIERPREHASALAAAYAKQLLDAILGL